MASRTRSARRSPSGGPLTPGGKQTVRRRLREWYARIARPLPWRADRDPYRVWVSEIMLQQTQVATVGPYFERFVARFPTLADLAAADEEEVLKLWEGLGYYRRARQMHRAARVVREDHGGRFPRDPEAVRALPGIGRYTAGAVLSIAFDAREPILEANSIRVLARLIGYRGPCHTAAGQRTLWEAAEALLPRRDVGTFNQALMELGSLVCRPREPDCDACPVRGPCAARAAGLQARIPRPPPKKVFEEIREAAVVVKNRGRILVQRRRPDERWTGLWDFPRFEVEGRDPIAARVLSAGVKTRTGLRVRPGPHLVTIRHGVTRFRITLECFLAEYVSGYRRGGRKGGQGEIKWVWPGHLEELPLSATGRRLARRVTATD